MSLTIEYYSENMEKEWDTFMLSESMNGTFLQTRKFLNYHGEGKFKDCSVCVRKGKELVAVIPACEIMDDGVKTFFAHKGSTYGGISVSPKVYSASNISEIMGLLEIFLRDKGFEKVYLKMVPDFYQRKNADLLDYFLYKEGYRSFSELNYYMHLDRYRDDITSQFSKSKRRDYRYSLNNDLTFKKNINKQDIADYYRVLLLNLNKLGLPAVHTLDDLYDLKFNRFDENIDFYGVYYEGKLIAGSMIFRFDNRIFHTQYLSSDEEYLKLFAMDFLIANLIGEAVNENMEIFSFGICTEDQGRYLNMGLSRFKEGFGVEFGINYSYEKTL